MTHSNRLQAYVRTALWSTNDESTESGGNPLDDNYTIDDLAPETLVAMESDLDKFFTFLERSLDGDRSLLDVALDYADTVAKDFDAEGRIAHDFWLTRCGHGAGFWDGDYGHIGGRLTKAAEAFGNVDLYVGDDGLIYQA
jgi:hypothetical protein